jgi:signal peptidase II
LESVLKKIIKEFWLLFTVTAVIIAADQITKAIIRANIPFGSSWMPVDWLAPFFRFVHWRNTGAAFGFFQGGGLVFGILAFFVTGFIIYYYPQIPKEQKLMRVAMAMQMGGALGNLIDRLGGDNGFLSGPVLDFISVGNFPVFNIADSSITVGVGLLILSLWISERKEKALNNEMEKENMEGSERADQEI